MVEYEETQEQKINRKLLQNAELMKKRSQRHWHANFGMIASLGGVIAMPIILCLWLGGYLDDVWPQRFSWRLTWLFFGFVWGFVNAYIWIKIEEKKIARLDEENRRIKEGAENE